MKRGTIITILFFLPLVLFLVYQIINRNRLLKDSEIVCGKVYKVYLNHKKGTTTRGDFANYLYTYNGVQYDESSEFYTNDVNEGDYFVIEVSKERPEIHNIYFMSRCY